MSASLYAMPKNLVLAASAGTGKTFALVGVVVHAFVRGAGGGEKPIDPARVVATTFSRKAAAEIRERVTSELERLAAAPATSPYAPALRGEETGARLTDDAIARRARHALARLPAARFGTLHGFATSIVRSYAVELGLGPGFDLATEADANARCDDAIARALETRFTSAPDAVRALAEAAGGIDRLVVQLRRTLGRLEEDGRAARDLVIPDGDARAMEAQLDALLVHARDLVSAPRFELAAREVLDAHRSGDEDRLEETVTALFDIDARGKKSPEVEAFGIFRRELPGARNALRGRNLVRAYRARRRFSELGVLARDVLAEAEEDVRRVGRARAQLGFGEILRAARELLLERPDVAEEVSLGLDALLVDEFQDTSRVQRDLLQLLWAVPGARARGTVPELARMRASGLLVVGDRKQSIYGFRGADVGVFAELAVGLAGQPAREALGIPEGVTWEPEHPLADFRALRHNRRSVAPVLAFANAFSARRFRPGDPPPELFEIEYVRETEDLLVPPEREAEVRAAGEATRTPRTTWLRVAPKGSSSSRLEEALVIAERVRLLVDRGEPTVGKEARAPSYRDIAVLATSNAMLDAVAFALAQADIPYVVAGKSFFRTREVRDLAAMLGFVLDPSDRLAMLEVLRGPWGGVHDETLLALAAPGAGLVPLAQWKSPPTPSLVRPEDRVALDAIEELVTALSRAAGRLGPGTILREAVRARALEDVLFLMPRGEQRVANVRKLLAIADRHEDARAFRAWLDQATEQELAESEAATFSEEDDAVRLLTVHASKGLDFPIVFVPEVGSAAARTDKGAVRVDLGAGDEPNQLCVRVVDAGGTILDPPSYARAYATAKRRERAERQRLAYVAITRAADAMFLVGGRSRDTALDPGASSLAVLEDLASSEATLAEACLAVEDVRVPEASIQRFEADLANEDGANDAAPPPAPEVRPRWRSLPIAPTALADFDHCARRFELVHLLGFPEHQRVRAEEPSRAAVGLDARAQGTLAHAVLERVPLEAFGSEEATAFASRALAAEGIPPDHAQHDAIVQRVTKFLTGAYAKEVAASGAKIAREVPFVLPVPDEEGREVVLRGNMDLVVTWPDGSVDVVDYKSARSGETAPYAFQLDVYALAARAGADVPRLRAGLVFLGGAAGRPVWRDLPTAEEIRARLARLGDRLVEARWNDRFPRVALDRCEAITCGFIGRCHADLGSTTIDEKPPRATTT